jgi:hypothetical protein
MRLIDLIGKKFGKLLVIERAPNKKLQTCWKCKCECGKEKIVEADHLRSGRTQSCGCAQYQYGENHRSWKGYKDIPQSHFRRIKDNANNRNIPFEIKIKDVWELFIKQNKKCVLSGLPLDFTCGGRELKHLGTASLDRIDSTKGYVKGNVQWIHKDVNWMKQDYSNDYFLSMCQKICDFQNSVKA